jgi:hypothetical protein
MTIEHVNENPIQRSQQLCQDIVSTSTAKEYEYGFHLQAKSIVVAMAYKFVSLAQI